jgi:hypothetical protein
MYSDMERRPGIKRPVGKYLWKWILEKLVWEVTGFV